MARDTVTLDFSQSGIFEGFGVHLWMPSPHITERDSLLRDLNARFVRANLPILAPDNQLPQRASIDDITALINRNATPATDAGIAAFREEITALGIRLHVIFWEIPNPWRKNRPDGAHLAMTEHLGDYANFMVGHLLYLRRMGIVPDYVELTNEPNGIWNTQFTPEQYDQLIVLARAGLDEVDLTNFKIEGPGTSNRPGDFMRELIRTGHVNLLDAYSFHEYDTRSGAEPAGLSVIKPSVMGAPSRPITITEFSSSSPRWNKPAALPGGRPDTSPPSQNPEFGISVVGEALQLIADGAKEILVWHLEDLPWQTARSGLLDRSGKRKPVADALVSIFGSVSPGSRIALPNPSIAGVPFVGFFNQKDVTLCAVNLSESDIRMSVRVSGLPDQFRNRHMAPSLVTTAFGSRKTQDALVFEEGGVIAFHLPMRSCAAVSFAT